MATAGPSGGGTFASVAPGDRAWANTSNAATSDNTRAAPGGGLTSVLTTTEVLKITNFGFAIPDGATINDITVAVERLRSGSGGPNLKDLTIQLYIADALAGDNKADTVTNWPATDGVATYVWTTDLPTVAQINAADFGVGIAAQYVSGSTALPQVDFVSITITYTEAGGAAPRAKQSRVSVGVAIGF